jgi:hypothetical protein
MSWFCPGFLPVRHRRMAFCHKFDLMNGKRGLKQREPRVIKPLFYFD